MVDLFYDVFKGMGEIGSEFVRVPNIDLNKSELAKDEQQVHYPARAPVPPSTGHKIVGQRAAKGISRIGKAAFRSPMTFTVGMAQGAHNLPKLWGDKTVRPQEKITGFGSGLKAAVKVCISAAINLWCHPYLLLSFAYALHALFLLGTQFL